MRKLVVGVILGVTMTALISAGIENYMVSKKTAEVERFQNLYVFTDSTPVLEYDYLGTVSSAMTLSGQYESVRNSLIKSAQKKYPQCDGIILHLVNGGVDKADVIKFK